jgi:hypothetical protein
MTDTVVPHVRDLNWLEWVKTYWGSDWLKPEVSYEFSNERRFYSTDGRDSGIYES